MSKYVQGLLICYGSMIGAGALAITWALIFRKHGTAPIWIIIPVPFLFIAGVFGCDLWSKHETG